MAPRASAKNFGSLTKSRSKRNTRSTSIPASNATTDIEMVQSETEYDESLRPDELGDQIDDDETEVNADDQHFDGILDDTNDIKLDAIISDLEAVPDGRHTFMSTTESMEIVSNVEIEFITSDNMHTTSLIIETMEPEPAEAPEEFSNPQYIINFVEELDKQQDGYDEQWQDDVTLLIKYLLDSLLFKKFSAHPKNRKNLKKMNLKIHSKPLRRKSEMLQL